MSLPVFSTQAELFSTAGLAGSLFGPTNRYRLFAQKVYPVLARTRAQLEAKELAPGAQVQLLARVFSEQFEVLPATTAAQPKAKEQLGSQRVQNPHDPDATYAAKGQGQQKKEHVGYKVQVAETVTETNLAAGEPTDNFISGIVTHAARESDEEGALKMEKEQRVYGMDKPPVQYVDAAYISTEQLRAAAEEGRELIGPAPWPQREQRRTRWLRRAAWQLQNELTVKPSVAATL